MELNVDKVKIGDIYQFNVLEDVSYNKKIIIPYGSVITGKVCNFRKPLLLRSDAYIDMVITSIQANSTCINLENTPIELRIQDPRAKTPLRKVVQRIPIQAANTGTSTALGTATNLSGGVIFAITIGAATAIGLITGFIDPDIDKTRVEGSIIRGFEATPVGGFLIMVQKGCNINFLPCYYVAIRFNNTVKQEIADTLEKGCVVGTNLK